MVFKALRLDEMVTKRVSKDGEKRPKGISRVKIKEESAQDAEKGAARKKEANHLSAMSRKPSEASEGSK